MVLEPTTLALMRMPLRYTLTLLSVVMGLGVVNKAALQLLYNQQHFSSTVERKEDLFNTPVSGSIVTT
jgi:hypothetical protein